MSWYKLDVHLPFLKQQSKQATRTNSPKHWTTKGSVLACNFIKKETLAEVLSYEFYENFKNTAISIEHLWLLLLFIR